MSEKKQEKWEVKIVVKTDYKPTFLNSLKADLSHHFDVPEKDIRIECTEYTDYDKIFKFLGEIIEERRKK